MPADLSTQLKNFRRKHSLSVNRLAQLTGISRRTLSRIEDDPHYHPSPRIKQRLSALGGKLLRYINTSTGGVGEGLRPLPRQSTSPAGAVEESASRDHFEPRGTRMTMYDHLLTPIYHLPQTDEEFERAVAILGLPAVAGLPAAAGEPLPMLGALSSPWLRFIVLPPEQVAERLREFRLRHDLTLRETAELAGVSVSHLQAIETGARHPSPRTCFRLMRLMTVPLPETAGHGGTCPELACPRQASRRGRANKTTTPLRGRSARTGRVGTNKAELLAHLRRRMSWPAALPVDSDPMDFLRWVWLTGGAPTESLAAELEISQPHLIRLLRGDRAPSRALTERILKLV